MKQKKQSSPWLAVSLGTLGLMLGYGIVLQQSGQLSAVARGVYSCPMKLHNSLSCASGVCSPECPGNCARS